MRLERLGIEGAWVVHEARHADHRGSFTRVADLQALRQHGLTLHVGQISYACNAQAGTIRGMHYQVGEQAETKLIWCVAGSALDVLVDVRGDSPTRGRYATCRLTAEEATAVLVGPGIAHGYQTLAPDTTLAYLIDAPHDPTAARTLRWDDPTVAIPWPLPPGPMSQRDAEAAAWPPAS
jgi:dTDP-4-dehydrorhamnose 3,5-epimerase